MSTKSDDYGLSVSHTKVATAPRGARGIIGHVLCVPQMQRNEEMYDTRSRR